MPGLFDRLQQDLDQRGKMADLGPADLLDLPGDERRVVQALARHGDLGLDRLAEVIGIAASALQGVLAALEEKGFVRPIEVGAERSYRTYFGRRRAGRVPIDIWERLAERLDAEEQDV